MAAFELSCGVGVVITPEQITQQVFNWMGTIMINYCACVVIVNDKLLSQDLSWKQKKTCMLEKAILIQGSLYGNLGNHDVDP